MADKAQKLSNQQLKQFRSIAHNLKPVVTVAQNGLAENVMKEIDRALTQHELIKVKVQVGDRELRQQAITEICRLSGAERVQSIGNIAVLFRAARQPDPKLSNLLRHGQPGN